MSRTVSIVGATGLVGREIIKVLFVRRFPIKKLLLFSSGRTPERRVSLQGRQYYIRPFSLDTVGRSGFCFLAAGGDFSRRHAHAIAARDNVVIDNSSVFRMDADVPLVVPEVNCEEALRHKGIIANPNCSTIQMVVVLAPLHQAWGLKRVVVSTYQSVSGAGLQATAELAGQSAARLEGRRPVCKAFRHPIAFNLIPAIDEFDDQGWTREERKLMNETRKILGDASIEVVATAVRVPVFRCHSETVYAEFKEEAKVEEAKKMLAGSPGVTVLDDPWNRVYPMPVDCAGKHTTFVGRIRRDPCRDNALAMWVVSDNVLKGAALNAVQIAEELVR